jgi:hypothetical protein
VAAMSDFELEDFRQLLRELKALLSEEAMIGRIVTR